MAIYEVYVTSQTGCAVAVFTTQSERKAKSFADDLIKKGEDAWYEQIQ